MERDSCLMTFNLFNATKVALFGGAGDGKEKCQCSLRTRFVIFVRTERKLQKYISFGKRSFMSHIRRFYEIFNFDLFLIYMYKTYGKHVSTFKNFLQVINFQLQVFKHDKNCFLFASIAFCISSMILNSSSICEHIQRKYSHYLLTAYSVY